MYQLQLKIHRWCSSYSWNYTTGGAATVASTPLAKHLQLKVHHWCNNYNWMRTTSVASTVESTPQIWASHPRKLCYLIVGKRVRICALTFKPETVSFFQALKLLSKQACKSGSNVSIWWNQPWNKQWWIVKVLFRYISLLNLLTITALTEWNSMVEGTHLSVTAAGNRSMSSGWS